VNTNQLGTINIEKQVESTKINGKAYGLNITK
jgi:hypothetical protein